VGKKLIYLGMDASYVRLAIADLSNLTPRTVPVKRVPKAEFDKLRENTNIEITGFVSSNNEITDTTYVKIAEVPIDTLHPDTSKETVTVYLSGAGKLRVLHSSVNSTNKVTLVHRQNVIKLSVSSLLNIGAPSDIQVMYEEFFPSESGISYIAQTLLHYGLIAVKESSTCLEVFPLDNNYTELTPYQVTIPKFTVSVFYLHLKLYQTSLLIDELTIPQRFGVTCYEGSDLQVGTIYACVSTLATFKSGAVVQRIVGSRDATINNATNSGSISGLRNYPGTDLLRDAGGIFLSDCYNSDDDTVDYVQGDVIIHERVTLDTCFNSLRISGQVICKQGVYLADSFNRGECRGVLLEGFSSSEAVRWTEDVINSFKNTAIYGNVELPNTYRITNSFTGLITGDIVLNPNLEGLLSQCFTQCNVKSFKLNPLTRMFEASLRNQDATLTVTGNRGSFKGIDVGELNWITTVKALEPGLFKQAKHIMSNTVDSITVLKTGSIDKYAGMKLDLRRFSNLALIESRAIRDCENLSIVFIDGDVKLKPSAFLRCKRLAHVYIGDNVKSISASAFVDLAPIINIYYNKNKAVERLGRIPRFKLHPNSTEEEARAFLDERDERLEHISVVATLAGISSTDSDTEANTLLQAVELSLTETGFCDNLADLYPVIKRCSKSISEVPWVVSANANTQSADNFHKEVQIHRTEYIRTLVGCITATYPYCEAVLKYAPDLRNSRVVLASDEYSFICSDFRVSGKLYWAYVIVENATNTIIHAFTIGPNRNEIKEIAAYLSFMSETAETCALLRYAEEVALLSSSAFDLPPHLHERVRNAFAVTWLPFGSFKLGTGNGVYGIDLYTGKCVVYGVSPAVTKRSTIGWWGSRLYPKGSFYMGTLDKLPKALLTGTADIELEKLIHSHKLDLVTEYDTTRIPLARDLKRAGEFLTLLKSSQTEYTVREVIGMMVGSELFRRDNRIKFNKFFTTRTKQKEIHLSDGVMTVYHLEGTQLIAVHMVYTKGITDVWYTGICRLDLIIDLLENICATGTTEVDPNQNIKYFSVTGKNEDIDLNFLTMRESYIPSNYKPSLQNSREFCLGVSHISFKACLYWKQSPDVLEAGSKEDKVVIFWFNSLKDAYKMIDGIGFCPFSINAFNDNKNMAGAFQVSRSGRLRSYTSGKRYLQQTQLAVMQGKPDNYILEGLDVRQEWFDLACKQPPIADLSEVETNV